MDWARENPNLSRVGKPQGPIAGIALLRGIDPSRLAADERPTQHRILSRRIESRWSNGSPFALASPTTPPLTFIGSLRLLVSRLLRHAFTLIEPQTQSLPNECCLGQSDAVQQKISDNVSFSRYFFPTLPGGKLRQLRIHKQATAPKCGDCHTALPGVRSLYLP